MKKTQCTSADLLPSKLIRPEDRIETIKRRPNNPSVPKKTIEIDAPYDDPTIRKKPRYEHSLSRLIKKNPRISSTINKMQDKCNNNDEKTIQQQVPTLSSPEHVVDHTTNQNNPDKTPDSISISSSISPMIIPEDTDIDKQLSKDLTVSDSEDETINDSILNTTDTATESDNSSTNQCSINDSSSDISNTDLSLISLTKPAPYVAEPSKPIPAYIPTPKTKREEKGRRALRYIPIAEWMFDQWRIISKANQRVGDAMKTAMIEEGLLFARK